MASNGVRSALEHSLSSSFDMKLFNWWYFQGASGKFSIKIVRFVEVNGYPEGPVTCK